MNLSYLKDLFTLYLFYLIPCSLVVGLSFLLTYRIIYWQKNQLFILIIPFVIWFLLSFINIRNKTLGNYVELICLAVVAGTVNIISIFLFKDKPNLKPNFDILLSSIIAVLIYFVFPSLPE